MRKTRLFLISLCVLMLATALFAQDDVKYPIYEDSCLSRFLRHKKLVAS